MSNPRSKLIVALDVGDRFHALDAVKRLSGRVGCFKVGLELFVREGPPLVEDIRSCGESVFLDLKLHDIPNTVTGAVRSACRLGIQMLTLHAAGGRRMLEAALEAAAAAPQPPMLLAVTALTSLSQEDVSSIGVPLSPVAWVEKLALLAVKAGIAGIVASPLELPALRSTLGPGVKLVIPGIRPGGSPAQDQSRTAKPGDAIRAGADYLVVGRPILQAPDPAGAADHIVAEIARELSRTGKP